MRKLLLLSAVLLAVAACDQLKQAAGGGAGGAGGPSAAAPAPAPTPAPAPPPPPAAEPPAGAGGAGGAMAAAGGAGGQPAAAPTAGNSVDAVGEALKAKGVTPTNTLVMRDKLGGKAECAAVDRKQWNLGGDTFVAVGNYGAPDRAEACLTAYKAFQGANWSKVENNYVKKGSFILELSTKLGEDRRKLAREAFDQAIAN